MRNGLGQLVHHQRDELGAVDVYADGELRYLTFGNHVEQSCVDLGRPERPRHLYTQAMVLALALRPAANALLLGLGGGGLAQALLAADPQLHIDAVEQRQAVIDLAHLYFGLPDLPRLHLHCADARLFVETTTTRYDTVYADLYLAEGAHGDQADTGFLATCRERLAPGGTLVLNQWCNSYGESLAAQAALREVFGDSLLHLQVDGGNVIAFASRDTLPDIKPNVLFEDARLIGNRLGFDLQRQARTLWRQNAQALKIARARRTS